MNEIGNRKTVEKNNGTKSWFFEKINRLNKPLIRLIEKKREKTHIANNRNEWGDITINEHYMDNKWMLLLTLSPQIW